MKRHLPAVLVAGWGVLNGLLLVVLAVYRENSMTYWLWGGVVLVVELAALSVLVSSRAGTDQHVRYRCATAERAASCPPRSACCSSRSARSTACGCSSWPYRC